jgi:protein-tyrosine phosphatase
MDDIIYGLDEGIFPKLGNTKYVLTELYPDAKPSEAIQIIKELVEHGYHPIIAHMERNFNITGAMVGVLIQNGAMIQVNAFSFQDESDEEYQRRAKELLSNRYVHFIGSDAHRINHRPPKIDSGIQYILNNIELEYAKDILYENARKHLNIGAVQES